MTTKRSIQLWYLGALIVIASCLIAFVYHYFRIANIPHVAGTWKIDCQLEGHGDFWIPGQIILQQESLNGFISDYPSATSIPIKGQIFSATDFQFKATHFEGPGNVPKQEDCWTLFNGKLEQNSYGIFFANGKFAQYDREPDGLVRLLAGGVWRDDRFLAQQMLLCRNHLFKTPPNIVKPVLVALNISSIKTGEP